MIPPDDRGLLLGDGLFETLRAEAGHILDWYAHWDRLTRGCEALGLHAPEEAEALARSREALRSVFAPIGALRITWTAGSGGRGLDRPETPEGRLLVSAVAYEPPKRPAVLITSGVRRNEGSPTSRLKSLAYLDNVLARREATDRGADEAVVLNTRGQVACATAANLFWFEDDILTTPALDCGVLDGVVRSRLIALAIQSGLAVREGHADPEVLIGATGLFLTNSLIGVRPVASLDGRPVAPHLAVGPLAQALAVAASGVSL